MALYVRTILLARDKRLFLSVTPMRRKKRLIIAVSARTPGSARARSGLTESRGIPKAARVRFKLWPGRRPAGMARAYSLDLRERVVGAVAEGQSCRSVAKTFMVSVASVVKWSQRHRAVGSPAALKMGGRRPYLVAREKDWVLARIAEKPDITLRALLKELADRGLVVSYYALWHFLHHEGVTFKKKPSRLRTGPSGRRQAA
jgi:transposase